MIGLDKYNGQQIFQVGLLFQLKKSCNNPTGSGVKKPPVLLGGLIPFTFANSP